MKPLLFVITVPHAVCTENNSNSDCDELAKIVGEKLKNKIDSFSKCKLFIPKLPRKVHDFNRIPSRKTQFRKDIKKYLKSKKEKYRIFLLDVHSYPGYNKNEKLDFYILDNYWAFFPVVKYIKPKFSFLINHFLNHFKSFKVEGFVGSSKNDIISEANELGLENILIEFNEKKKKKKFLYILNELINWIKIYFIHPKYISPVSGIIDKIEDNRIGVYIRGPNDEVQDDHKIYSPINGKPEFKVEQGKIINKDFKAFPNKLGKLIVKIKDYNGSANFEILVGMGYVTDNIEIRKPLFKKPIKLKQGEVFAEIILKKHNSYAYIYIVKQEFFKVGNILDGGKSCLLSNNPNPNNVITEIIKSKSFEKENLDSLDIYENLLIVTAKSTNELLIFDKNNLTLLKRFKNDLKRPNGIKIIKNLCFIVERDAHRISGYKLPNFELVYRFGSTILKKPYGIDGVFFKKSYYLYVTDNIGVVYIFKVNTLSKLSKPSIGLFGKFGENILSKKKIESILIKDDKIFVADENRKTILIFDQKLKYVGELYNKFVYDPEGIASYKNFIICVDQGKTPETNKFIIFKNLVYYGYFIIENTKNTDGICIDEETGMLYAIDDDKRISKIKFYFFF